MPFNRINLIKSLAAWLTILQISEDSLQVGKQKNKRYRTETEQETLLSDVEEPGKTKSTLIPHRKPLKYWVPGLLIVPIPEAGPILGYVDIAYLAVLTYIIGSVFYVVDSFYMWYSINPNYTDDAYNPAIYLNTIAAGVFVVNALLCFLDWYLQVKQLSLMNLNFEDGPAGAIEISDVSTKISTYYFYNNLFFLLAAVLFLVQGIWSEDPRTDHTHCLESNCNDFWINFLGGLFYLISSVFSCGESFEDRAIRKRENLPRLYLFTCHWSEIDWFGWGDLLYFLTALTSVVQPFFMYSSSVDDDTDSIFYLVSNLLFLVDSLVYLIGYLIFIYDIRTTLLTGKMPVQRTASISGFIGDNFEGAHLHGRTSFSFDPHHTRDYVDISEVKEQLLTAQLIKHRRSSEKSA